MKIRILHSTDNKKWPVNAPISLDTNIPDKSQLLVWCNEIKTVFNDYNVIFGSGFGDNHSITICGYVFDDGLNCKFETIQIIMQ